MIKATVAWDIHNLKRPEHGLFSRIMNALSMTMTNDYTFGNCYDGRDITIYLKSICAYEKKTKRIIDQINRTFLHERFHTLCQGVEERKIKMMENSIAKGLHGKG